MFAHGAPALGASVPACTPHVLVLHTTSILPPDTPAVAPVPLRQASGEPFLTLADPRLHTVWISRTHDLDRVRRLGAAGAELPGVGSRGPHTEASFSTIRRLANQRLLEGHEWARTGGSGRTTFPFRDGRSAFRVAPGSSVLSLPERMPFVECHALALQSDLCERMYNHLRA